MAFKSEKMWIKKSGYDGTYKGAELTLLSASLFPEIKMVIVTSPSGAVSQTINPNPDASPKSSWIYKNEPVPFVPFIYSNEFLKQFSKGYPKSMEFYPFIIQVSKMRGELRRHLLK